MNVATNVGKTFLGALDQAFPPNHTLHKLFNRNTVKISYSCTGNLKQNIDGHNKTIINKKTTQTSDGCNCRKPETCPMSGHCLKECVIYQATVTTKNKPDQTYVGLTENAFKTRYNNHKASFNNKAKRLNTELSKHIWELKEKNVDFKIKWDILKQAKPYNPSSKRCNLCTWEKYYIICKPEIATLNKRNELVSACRHANKFLLRNFVT